MKFHQRVANLHMTSSNYKSNTMMTQMGKPKGRLTAHCSAYNIENFKTWLRTSRGSSSIQIKGDVHERKSSWDSSPGWGIIANINIDSPKVFQGSAIHSLMWMHWCDSSIRVSTMSDDFPTPHRHSQVRAFCNSVSSFGRLKLQNSFHITKYLTCI